MRNLFFACICLFVISCAESDEDDGLCDSATLCLRNPSETAVVFYGWNTNEITDTLFPGECAEQVVSGRIGNGNTETFEFFDGEYTYLYTLDACYREYELERGFVEAEANCNNGEFNPESGELDTDCGGFCEPCDDFTFDCNLPENLIDIFLLPPPVELRFLDVTEYEKNIRIRFEYDSGMVVVDLQTPRIERASRKFVTWYPPLKNHSANITFILKQASQSTRPNESIYLLYEGEDQWRIKFCDVEFESSYHVSANMPFTYDP